MVQAYREGGESGAKVGGSEFERLSLRSDFAVSLPIDTG